MGTKRAIILKGTANCLRKNEVNIHFNNLIVHLQFVFLYIFHHLLYYSSCRCQNSYSIFDTDIIYSVPIFCRVIDYI